MEHSGILPAVKEKLREEHDKLNPLVMKKEIERLKTVLYDIQRKHGKNQNSSKN